MDDLKRTQDSRVILQRVVKMGDKGGRKDKEKRNKQKERKQSTKERKKKEKQSKGDVT